MIATLAWARGPPDARATPARHKLLSGPPEGWRQDDESAAFLGPGGKGGGPGRYHLQRRERSSQLGLRTRSGTAKVTTGENW